MIDDLTSLEKPELLTGGDFRKIDRRNLLKLSLAGVLASVIPLLPSKSAHASAGSAWRIAFRHAHTGESFSGVYRVGDRYLPEAFERMNYVLRDFRTGEVFPMDPRILDVVSIIQAKAGSAGMMDVLSGYRSPKTNRMLRNASTGVAKNSFHMYGQALDIRLPGYRTSSLRNIARSLRTGGVGYYSKSNFLHLDTGKVRSW